MAEFRRAYVVGAASLDLTGNIRISARLETASAIRMLRIREAPPIPSSSAAAAGGAIAWATRAGNARRPIRVA